MEIIKPRSKPYVLSIFTWTVVLLVSDLPNAVWQALDGEPPAWLFWAKIILLLATIVASLAWKLIQPVRNFFVLLLVLMLSLQGMSWLMTTNSYTQWQMQASWLAAMTGFQLLKLAVAFIMIAVLLLMGKKRKEFFLTRGQLDAPIGSGKRPISWGTLGLALGLVIAPITLLFFGLDNFPSLEVFVRALPLIPAALLFAATNAFSEETQFRASLLGDLQKAIGPNQAIWLTATFFGFAHYFGGAPAGIPGVLIAGLLGALFARCMLGSKGIAVPWFIHFCQNAVIYTLWAISSLS